MLATSGVACVRSPCLTNRQPLLHLHLHLPCHRNVTDQVDTDIGSFLTQEWDSWFVRDGFRPSAAPGSYDDGKQLV